MPNDIDKVAAFKDSARFYLNNKRLLIARQKSLKPGMDEQFIKYLQEDINFVEETLDTIYQKCGPAARLIIYRVFVDRITQSDVARENHLKRRKLQYVINKWLDAAFEKSVK